MDTVRFGERSTETGRIPAWGLQNRSVSPRSAEASIHRREMIAIQADLAEKSCLYPLREGEGLLELIRGWGYDEPLRDAQIMYTGEAGAYRSLIRVQLRSLEGDSTIDMYFSQPVGSPTFDPEVYVKTAEFDSETSVPEVTVNYHALRVVERPVQ